MTGHFLTALLAVLTLALTAGGFVSADYALAFWIAAGLLAMATIVAWLWESGRGKTPTSVSTSGSHSPAIVGDRNTVMYAPSPPVRPAQERLDKALDGLLSEGSAFRERLHERPTQATITNLLTDARDWQERGIQVVQEYAPDRREIFKASAGTFQPLLGQPGWYTGGGNWRRPYEERLERWISALSDLHS